MENDKRIFVQIKIVVSKKKVKEVFHALDYYSVLITFCQEADELACSCTSIILALFFYPILLLWSST